MLSWRVIQNPTAAAIAATKPTLTTNRRSRLPIRAGLTFSVPSALVGDVTAELSSRGRGRMSGNTLTSRPKSMARSITSWLCSRELKRNDSGCSEFCDRHHPDRLPFSTTFRCSPKIKKRSDYYERTKETQGCRENGQISRSGFANPQRGKRWRHLQASQPGPRWQPNPTGAD